MDTTPWRPYAEAMWDHFSGKPNVTIVMSGFTYWWDHEARRPQYFQRVLDALGGDRTAPANNWYFDAADAHTYGNPLNGYNIPTTSQAIP